MSSRKKLRTKFKRQNTPPPPSNIEFNSNGNGNNAKESLSELPSSKGNESKLRSRSSFMNSESRRLIGTKTISFRIEYEPENPKNIKIDADDKILILNLAKQIAINELDKLKTPDVNRLSLKNVEGLKGSTQNLLLSPQKYRTALNKSKDLFYRKAELESLVAFLKANILAKK